jgi:hypothetical protein
VQFKHENMSLWYGKSDTPAPGKSVQAGKEIPITIGVTPIDPSNAVEVRYRVNDGPRAGRNIFARCCLRSATAMRWSIPFSAAAPVKKCRQRKRRES